jgi:hypothetical protein
MKIGTNFMSSLADDFRMDTTVLDEIDDEEDIHVSADARGIPITKVFSVSIQGNFLLLNMLNQLTSRTLILHWT